MTVDKEKSFRRDTTWNVAFGYLNILLSLVRNILLVPLYLYFINLDIYGAWLASGYALMNIVMTDFGLAGATLQRISYLDGRKDYTTLKYSLGTSILSGAILSVALSFVTFIIAPYIASSLNLSGEDYEIVYNCLILVILANAFSVVGMVSIGILKSVRSPIIAGSIYALADIFSIAATVFLLFNGKGLYAIAIGLLIRSLLIVLFGILFGVKTCINKYNIKPSISLSESKFLLKNSLYLFVSSITMKLQTQADTFFVGVLIGPTTAGVYGLTIRAYEAVHMAINQVNRGLAPSLANMHGIGDSNNYTRVFIKFLTMIIFLAATGMGCLTLLNQEFVALWIGEENYAGNKVTILLALSGFVILVSSVFYDVVCSAGRFKLISFVFSITAIVHIGLIFILYEYFNYELTPLARLISSVLWGAAFFFIVFKSKYINLSSKFEFVPQFFIVFIISILIVAAVTVIDPEINRWADFIFYSIVYILVFFLTILFIVKDVRLVVLDEIKKVGSR